jgi:large conductance mechanosensitive channel
MIKGFKEFILRGNVIDLAVAVVIGAAFGAVIKAFIDGFINPLVAAIFGKTDLTHVMVFHINHAEFSIGLILNAIINFLFVAAAIYFVIVMPLNTLAERRKKGLEPEPEAPTEDVLLLQEIRDLIRARGGAV